MKDLDKFEMIVQAFEYEQGAAVQCAHLAGHSDRRSALTAAILAGWHRAGVDGLADGKRLDGFFKSTEGKFAHPQVRAWVEALYERRTALHASRGWTDGDNGDGGA